MFVELDRYTQSVATVSGENKRIEIFGISILKEEKKCYNIIQTNSELVPKLLQ